jgi:hypothetical protein
MSSPVAFRIAIAFCAIVAVTLLILGQPRWAGAAMAVMVLGLFLTPWHVRRG